MSHLIAEWEKKKKKPNEGKRERRLSRDFADTRRD